MAISKQTREGCFQVISVILALAIVLLFVILQKYPIVLPDYCTNYPVKDAQQVVNLLVVVVAIAVGMLMKYCLGLTNEAETASELRSEKLTIPRLHSRVEADAGSILSLFLTALTSWESSSLIGLIIFYMFAITVLGGVSSVLSVVFVLDTVRPANGLNASSLIALSQNIPATPDPCMTVVTAGGCTYDLAISALSSQLITHTSYSIAGVSFTPPNETRGLQYGALKQFSQSVNASTFGDELTQYCLPVLDRKMVSCREDTEGTRVKYEYLDSKLPYPVWAVTIDPGTPHNWTTLRSNTFGNGTMTVAQSQVLSTNGLYDTTIITATSDYADVLHQLMYGNSTKPDNFTAICTIHDATDNSPHVSWKWVSFTLNSGVLNADITEEICDSGMYYGFTGFTNLYFGLQGATTILGGSDGYSKLLNNNTVTNIISQETQEVANNYAKENGMTQLESSLSQIYHIIQTAWTATNLDIAKPTTIRQLTFPHKYIITISWTPATRIALAIAALILIFTFWLAVRWFIAVRTVKNRDYGWKLLVPIDLMGYSVVAQDDITDIVETEAQRKAELKKKSPLKFKNYPSDSGMGPYKPQLIPSRTVSGESPAISSLGGSTMTALHTNPKSPLIEKVSESIVTRATLSPKEST